MKEFNNLQELWNYCNYCSICMKKCRNVFVSAGPDFAFSISGFKKQDNKLALQCTTSDNFENINVNYIIDCINNTFDIYTPVFRDFDYVKKLYLYLIIEGVCKNCHNSCWSMPFKLSALDNKVFNISLRRETFYLLKCKDKFRVSFFHDENVMLVNQCIMGNEGLDSINTEVCELPLLNLDLTDQQKVVDKIKTLILFS